MTICCYLDSPVGRLALEADGETLTSVRWASAKEEATERAPNVRPPPVLKKARPKRKLLALEGVVLL